jgi:hypothetical protein
MNTKQRTIYAFVLTPGTFELLLKIFLLVGQLVVEIKYHRCDLGAKGFILVLTKVL